VYQILQRELKVFYGFPEGNRKGIIKGMYIHFWSEEGSAMAELQTGQAAPDFRVTGSDGKIISLSDFRGKHVILYFYPKDMTPG
jgi:hypothetical protein